MDETLRFQGAFAVWSYTIGHGRLLLRRPKAPGFPTRVDVLFKDTGWFCLPMTFDDLEIREVPLEEAGALLERAGHLRTAERRLFALSGAGGRGYVLAAVGVWHEDAVEYHEPSPLLE
jgi:hypothetical protein